MIRVLNLFFRPEHVHKMMLLRLAAIQSRPFFRTITRITHSRYVQKDTNVLGLDFRNPVGLASGFDIDGKHVGALSDLGFGFVEIGPLSPTAQNIGVAWSKRCHRNNKEKSISHGSISNNKGISAAISNLRLKHNRSRRCLVGINMAANQTEIKDEFIIRGFEDSFSLSYDFADYFVVNISNPNIDGVRNLQDLTTLTEIIDPLLAIRLCEDSYKPILVKVSCDIPTSVLDEMIDYLRLSGVDGIIVGGSPRVRTGGSDQNRFISGAPVFQQSLALIKHIAQYTQGRFTIVACGGIMSGDQANEVMSAGASLVQINTTLAFGGFRSLKKILKSLQ